MIGVTGGSGGAFDSGAVHATNSSKVANAAPRRGIGPNIVFPRRVVEVDRTHRICAATIAAASRRVDDPRAAAPWQVVITMIVADVI
jgi:hypothetical protein